MCLNNTLFALQQDNFGKFYGIGYKAIRDDLYGFWYNHEKYIFNVWMKSKAENSALEYPLGFHIFLNPESAKTWGSEFLLYPMTYTVHRVHFKNVLSIGHNSLKRHNKAPFDWCVVADEMFIPSL